MSKHRQTVCLCMIVKNEAPVIRRCLDSVRPLITHWLIVDTGSSDGTQHVIRTHFADLPGEVVERPWVDFAHNRSEALALARPRADYSLIIDADDEFVLTPEYRLPQLGADSYLIDIHYDAIVYQRPQLVRNTLAWRFRGVLHEFLETDNAGPSGHLPIVMRINHEGHRSLDPMTYRKDAIVLERALKSEQDPLLIARYTFYLAQSYRDCGDAKAAVAAYLRRATQGFWEQEIFVSLLNAGRLMEGLGEPPDAIIAVYERATQACPYRSEAAHAASRFCRGLGRFRQGYEIAKPIVGVTAPSNGLFVEPWIYSYGLYDEYAVNAYWIGAYRDCLDASLRMLESKALPASEQPRVLMNMRFSLDRLPAHADPAPEDMVRPSVPAQQMPTVINLGSGKDFRPDCLNIDIDATWSPDLLLDLSAARIDMTGLAVDTSRFGQIVLRQGAFDAVLATDVLAHVPNLVATMTSCLALLRTGGLMRISVAHDLSYGAWQDPTHLRAFNERSWIYYTDWFWYLGWHESRFVIDHMAHVLSPIGEDLRSKGLAMNEIVRVPRACDSMSVTLRKIDLTEDDRATVAAWRERGARPA